jgi:hypothetical protein
MTKRYVHGAKLCGAKSHQLFAPHPRQKILAHWLKGGMWEKLLSLSSTHKAKIALRVALQKE